MLPRWSLSERKCMCHCATADFTFHIGWSSQEFTGSFLEDPLLLLKKRVPMFFPLSRMWDYEEFTSSGNNCIVIWRENEEEESLWPSISWLHSDFAQDTYLYLYVHLYLWLLILNFCEWYLCFHCSFVKFWLFFWTDFWPSKICWNLYLHHWIQEPVSFFTLIVFFITH